MNQTTINHSAEIQKTAKQLKIKFPRIWRCADSGWWDDLKNIDMLSFDWLDKKIDYKKTDLKSLRGRLSIHRWVNILKSGDLIFVMDKHNYYGVCIAKSEYNNEGPFVKTIEGIKPAIKVTYIDNSNIPTQHNFQIHHKRPATFATIEQYGFGLGDALIYLYKNHPKAFKKIQKILQNNISPLGNEKNRRTRRASDIIKSKTVGYVRKTIQQEKFIGEKHKQMQNALKDYFESSGISNVFCEQDYVDVRIDEGGNTTFYEIKPYDNPILCMRESIGQLLQYRFFETKTKPDHLIAIGKNPLDKDAKNFLKEIRKQIPEFSYQQFDLKNKKLV